MEIIIQINGKVRDKIKAKFDIAEEEIKKIVLESEKIKAQMGGREIKKIVYVKNKILKND